MKHLTHVFVIFGKIVHLYHHFEMLLRKLENVTDILIGNSYNECLFFYFI